MAPLALYARVSTTDQRPEVQLDALRAYATRRGAEAVEFTDHGVSGRQDSRPALDAMMAAVRRREVDGVVVVKLDRLARSMRHLCELAEELQAVGADLVVLDQAIDTSTPSGRLLFGVLASVAAFEADLIRERTLAGLDAARRRGKRLGRPPAAREPSLLARVRRLRTAGRSLAEIGAALSVSKSMAAKLAREAAAA